MLLLCGPWKTYMEKVIKIISISRVIFIKRLFRIKRVTYLSKSSYETLKILS